MSPVPASAITIADGEITIDAERLAPKLGLSSEALKAEMRKGIVSSVGDDRRVDFELRRAVHRALRPLPAGKLRERIEHEKHLPFCGMRARSEPLRALRPGRNSVPESCARSYRRENRYRRSRRHYR